MWLETRLALLAAGGLLLLGLAGCDNRQGVAVDTAADAQQDREIADKKLTPVPDESAYTTGTAGRTENPGTATTIAPGVGGETDMSGSQDGQPGAEARQFIMTAAQINMLELQAAELAQERAGSEEVRNFANTMARARSRVYESLGELARNMGVQMPDRLDPQREAMLEKLRGLKGEAFDRTFSEEMVRSHRLAVQLFEDAAETAQDPRLQSFAQSQLPGLREHLKLAWSLPGAPRG